jgi:hypothetical protein
MGADPVRLGARTIFSTGTPVALPRPRMHYQLYYSTRASIADMHDAPQGLHDFLRGYYHHKSADWAGNKPSPLGAWLRRNWRSRRPIT